MLFVISFCMNVSLVSADKSDCGVFAILSFKNSWWDDSNNNEEKTSTTENQNIENTQQPQASQDVSSSIETESRNISQISFYHMHSIV